MSVEIQHVPDSDLVVMANAAAAGKLVAAPPTNATRAAGWVPSANFVAVIDEPTQAALKLEEYRTKCDQDQLETIRLNGMAHVAKTPSEPLVTTLMPALESAVESPGGSWPEATRTDEAIMAEPEDQVARRLAAIHRQPE